MIFIDATIHELSVLGALLIITGATVISVHSHYRSDTSPDLNKVTQDPAPAIYKVSLEN